ncbi:phage-related hypothetical protein [Bordetella bronchiseptica RB50]|uniref:Uncharacterized protein n=1 Tax=Bordetella bronchiseptica (strain ATCC BAA-588 / NCTC 13252 / RB50) TaxID=257310 RepID=A0A0H3M106_BORBR|nr:phage-related hypothetical protein [Bordetella bronchiseptica RB50]
MLKPRMQPALRGFLTCWTCAATCADFDVVVSANPCMLQCRKCASEARQKLVAGRLRANDSAVVLEAA